MGVAADLDYRFKPANGAQRALQALAASRGGAWVFARILPPLDTWVERVTHGRHTVPGLLAHDARAVLVSAKRQREVTV